MSVKQDAKFLVGVDVGGTKILAGLFTGRIRILRSRKIKTSAPPTPSKIVEAVAGVVRGLLADESIKASQVREIGRQGQGVRGVQLVKDDQLILLLKLA